MTSLEHLYKLFDISANQLGAEFIKTTPTRLQTWAKKHNRPFISLIDVSDSTQRNDAQNNIITFDCTFVSCVYGKKDPTDEQKMILEIEADKLVNRFIWYVNRNNKIQIDSKSSTESFRGASFNGVGRGFVLSITMADLTDYCEDYCNENTKNIDCES